MTISFILFALNLFFAFLDTNKYLAILNAFIAGYGFMIFIYNAKEKAKELDEYNRNQSQDNEDYEQ